MEYVRRPSSRLSNDSDGRSSSRGSGSVGSSRAGSSAGSSSPRHLRRRQPQAQVVAAKPSSVRRTVPDGKVLKEHYETVVCERSAVWDQCQELRRECAELELACKAPEAPEDDPRAAFQGRRGAVVNLAHGITATLTDGGVPSRGRGSRARGLRVSKSCSSQSSCSSPWRARSKRSGLAVSSPGASTFDPVDPDGESEEWEDSQCSGLPSSGDAARPTSQDVVGRLESLESKHELAEQEQDELQEKLARQNLGAEELSYSINTLEEELVVVANHTEMLDEEWAEEACLAAASLVRGPLDAEEARRRRSQLRLVHDFEAEIASSREEVHSALEEAAAASERWRRRGPVEELGALRGVLAEERAREAEVLRSLGAGDSAAAGDEAVRELCATTEEQLARRRIELKGLRAAMRMPKLRGHVNVHEQNELLRVRAELEQAQQKAAELELRSGEELERRRELEETMATLLAEERSVQSEGGVVSTLREEVRSLRREVKCAGSELAFQRSVCELHVEAQRKLQRAESALRQEVKHSSKSPEKLRTACSSGGKA
eukprot:TRINITY_DN22853_c0_g1_i1.p1 TRINITY_DN22853_c0_g1~~TRINITY_DN22853_c0_g1_i1.p1  ORF type:complete len:547 (+),score=145.53 TRINITY_DN22853_c0_g1_i1:287-1927(+)